MKTTKYIRWLGAIASSVILGILAFNARDFLGYGPDEGEILLYLVLAVLPSFLTIFLTAFGRFWWSFVVGLWLAFISLIFLLDENASPESMVLILAALTVCTTPFLNRVCGTKNIDVNEDAQQKNPPDKK